MSTRFPFAVALIRVLLALKSASVPADVACGIEVILGLVVKSRIEMRCSFTAAFVGRRGGLQRFIAALAMGLGRRIAW